MTKDDIIRIAREAGIAKHGLGWTCWEGQLERFAALVAAAERDACAKVAENRFLDKASCTAEEMYELQKKSIAIDIRARGQA